MSKESQKKDIFSLFFLAVNPHLALYLRRCFPALVNMGAPLLMLLSSTEHMSWAGSAGGPVGFYTGRGDPVLVDGSGPLGAG